MNDEQIKKIIDSPDEYDESKEDTYRSMLRDFFSKKMRWFTINFYVWSIFFMAVAIISAIQFFRTNQTKSQIMYAAIFICCSLSVGFCKAIAFVMISRHNIKREIKRLELRIAELSNAVKEK
jgi:NADH:ubiquinone oxidoreductase subunit 3 (subunit A)